MTIELKNDYEFMWCTDDLVQDQSSEMIEQRQPLLVVKIKHYPIDVASFEINDLSQNEHCINKPRCKPPLLPQDDEFKEEEKNFSDKIDSLEEVEQFCNSPRTIKFTNTNGEIDDGLTISKQSQIPDFADLI